MQRKSWILLLVSLGLCAMLGLAFVISRSSPEILTKEASSSMIQDMQKAVSSKNVGRLLEYIAPGPDIIITNMRPDSLGMVISRAFRVSGKLEAECSNVTFEGGSELATSEFDLVVRHKEPAMTAEDYRGHIKLHWRRVDVQHLLGLYHTKEWRIFSADTDGKDPSTFGDT